MTTPDDVDRFVADNRFSGARTHDGAELAALRSIRSSLAELWTDDEEEAVRRVNALLRTYEVQPQLVRHDGWEWHVHAVSVEAPLADRVGVEAAFAVVDVIRQGELGRLRRCAGEDCEAVLVDLSRNRSKRYCDVGNCGNRAHVAAYRARQAAAD